jgi:hypothetical protein
MQCAYCSQSVSGATDHKPCQEAVRLDKSRCGPQGKWFEEVMGPDGLSNKSPVDELLESFDI